MGTQEKIVLAGDLETEWPLLKEWQNNKYQVMHWKYDALNFCENDSDSYVYSAPAITGTFSVKGVSIAEISPVPNGSWMSEPFTLAVALAKVNPFSLDVSVKSKVEFEDLEHKDRQKQV